MKRWIKITVRDGEGGRDWEKGGQSVVWQLDRVLVLWLHIPPVHKWPIRNRKEPLLSLWGQRSVISSPPDTIQTEPARPQLHCSRPVVWGGQRQRSVEYLRPPGSTGKNNSCFGDEALLFSALVRIPSLPPVYSSPDPRTPAKPS